MKLITLAFGLTLSLIAFFTFADEDTIIGVNNEQLLHVSQDTRWRQLLAYDSTTQSAITSPHFFLSPKGRQQPLAELKATLLAFNTPVTLADTHPQCRFPARYLWLSEQFNFNTLGIKPILCPQYSAFVKDGKIDSISIIFATGYLGNPASYYGHLLLKMNSPSDSKTTDLESTSINFGANVPAHENMLVYIAKGIFGGYNSSFTDQQFFYHSHNYGESELRDLWEYRLDLDKNDLQLLIAHVWEILGVDYTYYFFNRNCAYRIGDLLQLVSSNKLVEPWRPWETPQAIMQRLSGLTYKDRPILKKVEYHPSRQSRLYQRYAQLNKPEKTMLRQLVENPAAMKSDEFEQLDLSQKFKVVDTLIDYYQFVRQEKLGAADINNEYYRNALSERYQLPPGEGSQHFSSENQPHLGRKPSYLNLGFTSSDTIGGITTLWLRPAYYDSLDAGYGHIKNASLSMMETTLGVNDSQIFIRDLNAIKIESLRRNFTGLPGDRHSSWYLEAGAQQEQLGGNDRLATKIRSGYGYATSLFQDKVLIAGFAGGGFLGRSTNSDQLYVSGLATLNWNISEHWALRTEAEDRYFNNGEERAILRTQIRLQTSSQTDARLYFTEDKKQEFGISMGLYW